MTDPTDSTGTPADGADPAADAHVPLRNAREIVDALTDVTSRSALPAERIDALLRRFAPVIGPEFDYTLLLFEQLDRRPVPRLVERFAAGLNGERLRGRTLEETQRLLDFCGPLGEQMMPLALADLRNPVTFIYGQDAEPAFFADVYQPYVLVPNGWADCMACYWAASRDHLIVYNVLRRDVDRKFTQADRELLSLLTRAVAPVMDARLFDDMVDVGPHVPPQVATLDPALRPILLAVLHGCTDREIAQLAGTMTDYVEILVRKIYAEFGVTSRGELLAMFVDQRVLNWLEDDGPRAPRER